MTAIISGGVPKPFLLRWAARAAAEYAIAHLDHLAQLPPGQAVREVKQAPWTRRDDAADLGDAIHAVWRPTPPASPAPTCPTRPPPT